MEESTVCIFCAHEALHMRLKKQLAIKYQVHFSDDIETITEWLRSQEIDCLIAYPFQSDSCIIWKFHEIKKKFATVPLIVICTYTQLGVVQSCLETTADEFLDLDEINQLSEVVQSAILRKKFQKRVSSIDGVSLKYPPRVKKALTVIHAGFTKIKYAEEVSGQLGISVNTFRKEFKEFCGLPFTQYLIRLKLHYATYLGQNNGLLAKDIANLCGFEDEHAFYHLFKRKMGFTFSEFRSNGNDYNFNRILKQTQKLREKT